MNTNQYAYSPRRMTGLGEAFQQRVHRTQMREEMLRQQPGHVPARSVSHFLKTNESEGAPMVMNKSRR